MGAEEVLSAPPREPTATSKALISACANCSTGCFRPCAAALFLCPRVPSPGLVGVRIAHQQLGGRT